MRYLATATTRTPDGRNIPAGEYYDYPMESGSQPETLHEMTQERVQSDAEAEAHFRGEAPPERKRGRPFGSKNKEK